MGDQPAYDLFISYAEADRAWVEGYLLPQLGLPADRVLTQRDFAPGRPLVDEYARAIDRSRHTLLVLSPAFVADRWGELAKDLAVYLNAEGERGRLIPLRLQSAKLGLEVRSLVALDFDDAAGWDEEAAKLRRWLDQPPPVPASIPCPYPGLRAFRERDHERFFGREDETRELLARLSKHPFQVVIGRSGSGKSSVVFAGLVPRLRTSGLFGQGDWAVYAMRPGASPMAAATVIVGADPPAAGPSFADLLAASQAGKVLVVVDQFEELFAIARVHTPEDEIPFQEALAELTLRPGWHVVVTVRADFYTDLMDSPLWPEIQAHRLEVLPLGADGLRSAIAEPAKTAGVYVETALVERLVADAAGEPGVLPLVQETLVYLWEGLRGRYLGVEAYEALARGAGTRGEVSARTGLQAAMARHSDDVLDKLSAAHQGITRRIFLRLVQFGEGRPDTRRQQPVAALRAAADDPAAFEMTLAHLATHRLLTLGGGEDDAGRTADLAHEALIGGWPRLQEWLGERRVAEQARRRLEAKAEEWARLGRGAGGLLDEAELPEAEQWLVGAAAVDLGYGEDLPALVGASRDAIAAAARERVAAEAEREATRQRELTQAQERAEEQAAAARRLRRRLMVAAGSAALALAAALVALYFFDRAGNDRDRAEAEAAAAATAQAQAEDNANLAEAQATEAAAAQATAEWQANVSRARALAAIAPQQHEFGEDERGALLARQAFLVDLSSGGQVRDQVDGVLRSVLGREHFSRILRVSQGTVSAIALSPDGRILATGGDDGAVHLWDLGDPAATPVVLRGHEDLVSALAIAPDGRVLASGGGDGSIRLWDLGDPAAEPAVLADSEDSVFVLAFAPDGRTLAAGGGGGTVRLWNLADPAATPMVFIGHEDFVKGIAFTPDGRTLVTGSWDGTVRLWDPGDPAAPSAVLGDVGGRGVLAVAPDGRTLATGGFGNTVRLWNLADPAAAPAVLGGNDRVEILALAFASDGRTLVSSGTDATVRLWDPADPAAPPVVLRHDGGVSALALSSVGQVLAAGGDGGTVRLWDLGSPAAAPIVLRGNEGRVSALAYAPDGRTVAAGGDGTIRLWDLGDPAATPMVVSGLERMVLALAFSPDGRTLAVGGASTVRLWNLSDPAATPTDIHRSDDEAWSLAFAPDGRVLASGGGDGTIRLWDLGDLAAPPTVLRHSDDEGGISALAFAPDGRTLAAGGSDGTVRLWDLADPAAAPVVLRGHEGRVSDIAFSPDGQVVATGSWDGTIRLWDPASPASPPAVLQGHEGQVVALAFASDGQALASSSNDGTARLWSPRNPAVAPAVLRNEGGFGVLAFAPDGQTLAFGSSDGTVGLQIARTETLAEVVCRQVWRNLTLPEWTRFVGEDVPYESTCPNLPPGEGAPGAESPTATPVDQETA